MYLQTGEQISLSALLHALMLQSSNDAAVAIAEHIGGNVDDFCSLMTSKAHQLGAVNTFFQTPNGLDAENHQSTAHDMALITRYALSNAMFLEIINTPQKQATSNRTTYAITNKNRLLNEFEGANGVKTGYTGKAGHCFVGAAKRDDMQLISVVFASGWGERGKQQKWKDTKEILNYGFENYKNKLIIEEGDIVGEIAVTRSKTPSIQLYFSDSLIIPVCNEDLDNIQISFKYPNELPAPIKENQEIGMAYISIGSELYTQLPVYTKSPATRHDLPTSIKKVFSAFESLIISNP